jgi:hypothetical protein
VKLSQYRLIAAGNKGSTGIKASPIVDDILPAIAPSRIKPSPIWSRLCEAGIGNLITGGAIGQHGPSGSRAASPHRGALMDPKPSLARAIGIILARSPPRLRRSRCELRRGTILLARQVAIGPNGGKDHSGIP